MNIAPDSTPLAADADAWRREQQRRHESMINMATGIAHDFNNYIAAIVGNNNVIMRALNNEARARECGQRIEAAAELALHLTDQLATYSGRIESNPEEMDIAEMLAALSTDMEPRLPRGVRLETALAPDCPPLFADPRLVRRLLVNLVTNSADAMLDLQGDILVSVGPHQPAVEDETNAFLPWSVSGSWIALTVRDPGCGMTTKVLDRCFDPLFSTKIRGRGMGLPEVLGIVRLHEGNVVILSRPGSGTTVKILLPVLAAVEPT